MVFEVIYVLPMKNNSNNITKDPNQLQASGYNIFKGSQRREIISIPKKVAERWEAFAWMRSTCKNRRYNVLLHVLYVFLCAGVVARVRRKDTKA